ncbi:MAG: hypothetical protein M3355_03815 [Actinomycetota bacterium]|nr:hypothetical protein [Actinomycetota bacterium]
MEGGPFRYHLELTPEQLKIVHTALSSLLDDFGHDEPEIHRIIRALLDKLPDEHAIRAIRIGEDGAPAPVVDITRPDAERPGSSEPPEPDDDPSAA